MLAGVVPYIPTQNDIDNTTDNQFHAGYNKCAGKALFPQIDAAEFAVGMVEQHEDNASGNCHGPVGKAAPEQLQQAVSGAAHQIDNAVFLDCGPICGGLGFFHCFIHLSVCVFLP